MTDQNNSEKALLLASYELLEGTRRYGPYVDCSVFASGFSRLKSKETIFKARIDSGSDITCIPREYATRLMPLEEGKRVQFRGATGKTTSVCLKKLYVEIHFQNGHTERYRPARGVVIRDSDIGMIGLDILNQLDIRLCDGKLYINPLKGGGE